MISDKQLVKIMIDECGEYLKKSTKIAEKAHKRQTRKMGADKGKPYIIHPKRIASKFNNRIMASIAMLHYVLEDTDVTDGDLVKEGIPLYIIDIVKILSKRDGENYLDFILRIKNNIHATQIKIADIEDNLSSLQDGSLKDKYILALYILKHE